MNMGTDSPDQGLPIVSAKSATSDVDIACDAYICFFPMLMFGSFLVLRRSVARSKHAWESRHRPSVRGGYRAALNA
jgi:hypothetical protein